MRHTINQLSRVVNYHTDYMGEYRESHNELYTRHLYWFMMWLRPVTLALYKRPKAIKQLMRSDDIPQLVGDPPVFDVENPAIFEDKFMSEDEEGAEF